MALPALPMLPAAHTSPSLHYRPSTRIAESFPQTLANLPRIVLPLSVREGITRPLPLSPVLSPLSLAKACRVSPPLSSCRATFRQLFLAPSPNRGRCLEFTAVHLSPASIYLVARYTHPACVHLPCMQNPSRRSVSGGSHNVPRHRDKFH